MSANRRTNDRIACHIGVVVNDGHGGSRRLALTDLSEHGAFLRNDAPLRPGSKLDLSFPHPRTGQPVNISARVARRVVSPPGQPAAPGNGLYFEQDLGRFESERRTDHRDSCTIFSKVQLNGRTSNACLEDISEGGGLLRAEAALAIGAQMRVAFRHPRTKAAVMTWALVVRGPIPLEAGGYGYGVCFDETLTELAQDSSSVPMVPSTGKDLLCSGYDVTSVSDDALGRQGLTRRVRIYGPDGQSGGELVAVSRTEFVIRCSSLPAKGSRVTVGVRRPAGRGVKPMLVYGTIRRVGPCLIGGRSSGFILTIEGFAKPDEEASLRTLLSCLKVRELERLNAH
jgi:hypothetical protein